MTSSPTRRLMEHSVVRYSPIDEIPSHTDDTHTLPTEEIHAILITSQTTSESTQTDELDTSSKHCCYRYRLLLIMTTLLLTVALILSIILISTHTVTSTSSSITTCDIFCYGDILHAIETSGILHDSKSFVDMPLLRSPDDVMNDFRSLDTNKTSVLIAFLNRNFAEAGTDLLLWHPEDFKNEPKFLKEISDPHYHKWASELNALWLSLGKQISPDVYQHPERHTLLPALSPYMIVPGGRFREYYYWDSYWIVRGLITCDMLTTAKIIVENLLFFVRTYGFVPNGSRIYYLNRSQPPFLTLTVQAYFNATQDHDFLRDALPVLDKEYEYWMKIGAHAVSIQNKTTGNSYILNRYYTNVNYPRPESYAEDMATALSLPWPFNPEGTKKREEMFAQLAASAETGWDFSSRFFQDRKNLSSANTMDVIPVDLNAILYINERTLGDWHKSFNHHQKSQYYHNAAEQRLDAIEALLWDGHHAVWRDYNWRDEEQQDIPVASNFIPLWAKCYRLSTVNESRVLSTFLSSGLIQPGGIVTTRSDIGQQWDWPNAWAPIQHMITEGLATLSGDAAVPGRQQALALASTWLASNWMAYNTTGVMFEKYVATMMGQPGHGGEYILQKGFGWTNGVALILLEQYGDILNLTHTLIQSQSPMLSRGYDQDQYTLKHHHHHPQHTHQHTHRHEPHHYTTMSAIDHHNIRLNNLLSPHLVTGTFALSHQHDDIPSYHIMMQTSSRIRKHMKKQRAHVLQPETNIIQPAIPVVSFPHIQAHTQFVERMQQKQQQQQQQHMEIS